MVNGASCSINPSYSHFSATECLLGGSLVPVAARQRVKIWIQDLTLFLGSQHLNLVCVVCYGPLPNPFLHKKGRTKVGRLFGSCVRFDEEIELDFVPGHQLAFILADCDDIHGDDLTDFIGQIEGFAIESQQYSGGVWRGPCLLRRKDTLQQSGELLLQVANFLPQLQSVDPVRQLPASLDLHRAQFADGQQQHEVHQSISNMENPTQIRHQLHRAPQIQPSSQKAVQNQMHMANPSQIQHQPMAPQSQPSSQKAVQNQVQPQVFSHAGSPNYQPSGVQSAFDNGVLPDVNSLKNEAPCQFAVGSVGNTGFSDAPNAHQSPGKQQSPQPSVKDLAIQQALSHDIIFDDEPVIHETVTRKVVPQIHEYEEIVEVPQLQVVDREVKVPQIQEIVKEVPGEVHQTEITRDVPVINVQVVERVVEVPVVEYKDIIREVSIVQEVIRRVPRIHVHEIPIERIVRVPKRIVQEKEQPIYRPVPHLIRQAVEREILVPKVQIETKEVVGQLPVHEGFDGHGHGHARSCGGVQTWSNQCGSSEVPFCPYCHQLFWSGIQAQSHGLGVCTGGGVQAQSHGLGVCTGGGVQDSLDQAVHVVPTTPLWEPMHMYQARCHHPAVGGPQSGVYERSPTPPTAYQPQQHTVVFSPPTPPPMSREFSNLVFA